MFSTVGVDDFFHGKFPVLIGHLEDAAVADKAGDLARLFREFSQKAPDGHAVGNDQDALPCRVFGNVLHGPVYPLGEGVQVFAAVLYKVVALGVGQVFTDRRSFLYAEEYFLEVFAAGVGHPARDDLRCVAGPL